MITFTQQLTTTIAYDSVRTMLQQLMVPKTTQHELRIHQSVLINGTYQTFNQPVATGAQITLTYQDAQPPVYVPTDRPVTIVYEDHDLLIVDKPAGIKAHPNQPDETQTLMNRVAAYLAPMPAYITHRLDMLTSGLTLIAKDPLTQNIINRQLAQKTMTREYVALVAPDIPDHGTITAPIGSDPTDKRKRMVAEDGLPAVTHYQVVARTAEWAQIQLQLETGRTHQIRVHLASIGFPILGDPLYAPGFQTTRLFLHAETLRLTQPFTAHPLVVHQPAPFGIMR